MPSASPNISAARTVEPDGFNLDHSFEILFIIIIGGLASIRGAFFGAALIARDRIVSSVNDTVSTYASPTKTQAQLRRFERRGLTARNRLEREVRKARVRFERELRQRRREIDDTVSELEERRDALANRVPELANRVQERIQSLV